MPWYVIRTKPHQERLAHLHLSRLCEDTFLPLIEQNVKIWRQEKTVVEPLFPGYLFARFDLEEHYRAVKFARGVLHIVEFGFKPAEIKDDLIDAIKQRVQGSYVRIAPPSFQSGQVIQISGGPLAGLEAILTGEMSKQHRVSLLLNMLGSQVRLTMDIDQIGLLQVV